MAITYYPNETDKKLMNVVEELQQPNVLYSIFGVQDLSVAPLSTSVWCPKGWEVKRVSLNFSSASAKSYAVSVVKGIGVSTGKNDRLWIGAAGACIQEVYVPQGFYDGTTLPIALAAALNSSSLSFPSAAKPFTAGYVASTGLATITPASGNVRLLATNTLMRVRQVSTFAPLVGFTTDVVYSASLVSDTATKGIGTKMAYVSSASSTNVNIFATDTIAMTIDDALLIESTLSGAAPDVVSYEVVYRILDA